MMTPLRVPLLLLALQACGSNPEPEREWTPADHGQPESAEPGRQAPAPPSGQVDPEQAQARAAQALWNISCATCHGRGGRGDGAARPPGTEVPDFTAAAWQQERDNAQLAEVIRDGRGLMPEFGKQINPQGISALVKHIRSLNAAPPSGSPSPQPTPEDTPTPAQ